MLPVWQRLLQPHVESGAVVAVGVVQEQHPDRIRLYAQWRKLGWPVFVDALNLLDHQVVPIIVGINASGLVVMPSMRPDDLDVFLAKDFAPREHATPALPHPLAADAFFHAGKLDEAVAAYAAVVDKEAGDARAQFRLGVALLRRFESDARKPGDAQAAVGAWTRALALRPDQYIWRRRIQQYGPRLDKPYNMFGWIEEARGEIRDRGDEPVALAVEPRGTELVGREPVPTVQRAEPDREGKVPRDEAGLAEVEPVVTPARVRPGARVRVRLVFRVPKAFWNNEADPIAVHVAARGPFVLVEGNFAHPVPEEAETREERVLEFELAVADGARPGLHDLPAYALYNVCEKVGGQCLFLRRDFTFPVHVDPDAPKIQ